MPSMRMWIAVRAGCYRSTRGQSTLRCVWCGVGDTCCLQETVVVAAAPKLAAMRACVARCQEAVEGLAQELATRDATVRQQADRIAALEEEVQRLRAG